MQTHSLVQSVLQSIEPGQHVLDLGAGRGDFAHLFADRGAEVTAVDANVEVLDAPSITALRMTVEEYVAKEKTQIFHVVFMRNILQFLEKHWVFEMLVPWLDAHVQRRGLAAMTTMYRDPDPPFDRPLHSLYTIQELIQHFSGWQELIVQEYEENGPDMRGTIRHFFITDFLVRKVG